MRIYTIGFTKKNAETFFELLRKNNVRKLLDIRLNNVSQLAGFAKGSDLEYFIKTILNIGYKHDIRLSPTKDLLDRYKAGAISWNDYEKEFNKILLDRNVRNIILNEYTDELDGICLLCSEFEAKECHRRLVAEFIRSFLPEVEIIHL